MTENKLFDITEEDEHEELKKLDPLATKYFKMFEALEERAIRKFIQYNQRFQLDQLLNLQNFIMRLADEIAKNRQENIKTQIDQIKEVVKELMQMFTPTIQTTTSQPALPNVKINIQESDEEPQQQTF